MATDADKPVVPAYTSYKPLFALLNQFREDGHVPMRVDKSHMGKASGSVIAGHLHALRFLKLIDADGRPLPLFSRFVLADDAARSVLLAEMLSDSYSFIFPVENFDLARASGRLLEERFRAQDIKGSTVIRAISFFLNAAKDAGLKLAPGLKAPAAPPRNGEKKSPAAAKKEAARQRDDDDDDDDDRDGDGGTVMKFEIPIPINRKVKISIPSDFDEADWTLLQTMFNAYVTRWKGISVPKSDQKEVK